MAKEEDDDKPPRNWGDFGALVIAGGFSLFGLYLIVDMLLGGHPLAVLFRPPAPEQAQSSKAVIEAQWNEKKFTTAPGEIIISTSSGLPAQSSDAGFPQIRDWTSLRITLERSLCYGTCPSYSVQISGDGNVVFHGQDCVSHPGEHKARIAGADVARLVQKFQDADYFSLRSDYTAQITDNPRYRTGIVFDGKSKSVGDYAGGLAGMPRAVSALEDAIDNAAGTQRWVYGGPRNCGGRPVDDSWRRRP